MALKEKRLEELLLQALETEKGGVQVYEAAIECAVDDDLREEWTRYLDETREHLQGITDVVVAFGLDPNRDTPGRAIVRTLGQSLVSAIRAAKSAGDDEAAELVAAECVVLAETKDHLNWKLLGACAEKLTGEKKKFLADAAGRIEAQEDEHLWHSSGWARECWMKSLGLRAVLPPPEEQEDVKSMAGAAKAEKRRSAMKSK